MTRLARECAKSVAVLAIALIFGLISSTSAWAQGTAPKKQVRRARPAASPQLMARPGRSGRPIRPGRRIAKAMAKHTERRLAAAAVVTPALAPAAKPALQPADQTIDLAGKRDPFAALINTAKPGGPPLPPGKAGLVIGTLTVQGTVQGANGMIAVIANPDQRVYFVREGDRLYDGVVEKINLDSVTFQQDTKDAFGKPIERTVVKRLYPSAGDQQ